jgi:hypothetical protein
MVTTDYNNYSDKLKAEFRAALKEGPMTFRVRGIRIDFVTKKAIIPNTSSIAPTDRIFDPYKKPYKDDNGEEAFEGDYVV